LCAAWCRAAAQPSRGLVRSACAIILRLRACIHRGNTLTTLSPRIAVLSPLQGSVGSPTRWRDSARRCGRRPSVFTTTTPRIKRKRASELPVDNAPAKTQRHSEKYFAKCAIGFAEYSVSSREINRAESHTGITPITQQGHPQIKCCNCRLIAGGWCSSVQDRMYRRRRRAPSGPNLTLRFAWGFPEELACASLGHAQANGYPVEPSQP
jgi:hypothetical protein